MNPMVQDGKPVPIGLVGSNTFGQTSKISGAQTYNMSITIDEETGKQWLVPTSGFKVAAELLDEQVGRTIFVSQRFGKMITVVGNSVFALVPAADRSTSLSSTLIGTIGTYTGDVFIAENIAGQIAICDKKSIWIYNWKTPTNPALIQAELPVDQYTGLPILPGYITYQDGYFITVNTQSASWFLSAPNDGTNWNWSNISGPVTTTIQTKSTNAVGVLRAPGRGNLLYVIGQNVVEFWDDVGAPLFPYRRSTAVSNDYGCISPNTISSMDTMVAWLGTNEGSGPVIMISSGAEATRISSDGIDYKLSQLNNPAQSYGFFFKQNGHLFYQITFSDPSDNFSLLYDFVTKKFFYVTDENMNYHPAESVAFFNNNYYFVSINDGNVYLMSSDLTSYDYTTSDSPSEKAYTIPSVRICHTLRLPDNSRFSVSAASFTMSQGNDLNYKQSNPQFWTTETGAVFTDEQGRWFETNPSLPAYQPYFEYSVSTDGANFFGAQQSINLNPLGKTQNRILLTNLGSGNEFTMKFRFNTRSRFSIGDGEMAVRTFT